jgi:hypothetical protein
MAFSLDDLRNIVQGTPTAETMVHAQQAHAMATHNLPAAALEHATSSSPNRLYEQDVSVNPERTMSTMENMLAERLAKKASQASARPAPSAPAPSMLREAAAPVIPPVSYFTPPPGGYPGPGLPATSGNQAGSFGPDRGGVPLDFLNKVTGQALPINEAPRVLVESQLGGVPLGASPEALRTLVREVIMTEVLGNDVLAPLLEQLVKANLRTIVREELTRLQQQGQQQGQQQNRRG